MAGSFCYVRPMKALVTGVSGFIGPHVIEACLKRGWDVAGIDLRDYPYPRPKGFSFTKMDVRALAPEDLKDVDYVIHLAFVTNIPFSIKEPLATTRDNIDMTACLLDRAATAKVKKLVFSSTASLYGDNPTPWREDMPPDAIEPYCWQKLSGEYACRMWSKRYGLPTVSLRLFQVYGENQRSDTAFAKFFDAKRDGKPITLTETTAQSSFRTGQRDFVYVKDVAEAFACACASDKVGKGEIVNIGTGLVTTMEQVAKAILGEDGEVTFIPKRGFEVERHEADITQARALLGWEPSTKDVLGWLVRHAATLR